MEGLELDYVALAQQGDREAFAALVDQYTPSVYRAASAVIGEAPAADAVQEAFIAAWRQLPRLRDTTRFGAWLYRIVINECRDVLRKRRRVREVKLSGADSSLSSDPRAQVELRAELASALAVLSVDQRVVIGLHYGANLTIAESAGVLGISIGTFKSRLSAALAVLRRELRS